MRDAKEVVAFWREAGPKKWFRGGAAFDRECEAQLSELHVAAASRKLDAWQDTAEGALALLILLDQIPRNIFRGTAHAYATDPLGRMFARHAIAAGFDAEVDRALRLFLYLPFEHSEDPDDQAFAVQLHRGLPLDVTDEWAVKHCDVIRRFGRFPHRNAALGRTSTAEELEYLAGGGGF